MTEEATQTEITSEEGQESTEQTTEQTTQQPVVAGHKSKEEFVRDGGRAEEWQSPEVFQALKPVLNKMKDQSKRIKQMEVNNTERINNLNTLHNQQMDVQKAQLAQQRQAAVEDGDLEKFNSIQTQMDNIKPVPQEAPQQPQMSQELHDWNSDPKNSWMKSPGAKSTYAHQLYSTYNSQGYDDVTTLQMIDRDMAREFPDINPNITGAPRAEGGSRPGNKAPSKTLTMKDLTAEEAGIWKNRGTGMWANEKDFLKAVEDSRSAE